MIRKLLLAAAMLVAGPVAAHEPYSGLKSPSGRPCCGGYDCQAVSICTPPGGGEGILLGTVCRSMPYEKLISAPGLRGLHACWKRGVPAETAPIYCVMAESGA